MTVILQKSISKQHMIVCLPEDASSLDGGESVFFTDEVVLEKDATHALGIHTRQVEEVFCSVLYIKLRKDVSVQDCARLLVGAICKAIRTSKKSYGWNLDTCEYMSDDEKRLIRELLIQGMYVYDAYKKPEHISKVYIQDATADPAEFTILQEAITNVRNIINAPTNDLYPESFEENVRSRFTDCKHVTVISFDEEDLQKHELHGVYAVGRGSERRPRLVFIEYRPQKDAPISCALVGKGVTFDSGGYNIKPTGGIEDMKMDMGGAAVVLGAFEYLVRTGYDKNLLLALPMVENLVSRDAYKPADVIKMYNGLTVEVMNTDAEGRLILADTLAYVEKNYTPEYMIDVATLSGAQLVALGTKIGAVMGPNTTLNQCIQKEGYKLHEYMWELPFMKEYLPTYKSSVADTSNIPNARWQPGCIAAGLFLSQFVTTDNWAHLDVAGPVLSMIAGEDELYGSLGSGFGVRLLSRCVQELPTL